MSVFISLFATQDVIFNSKALELPNALKSLGNLLSNQDKIPHIANQFNTHMIRSNHTSSSFVEFDCSEGPTLPGQNHLSFSQ